MDSCTAALDASVSIGYAGAMSKDSGMRIRIERGLRDRFIEICREQDKPAAQVLREFMRDYVGRHVATNENASTRGPHLAFANKRAK